VELPREHWSARLDRLLTRERVRAYSGVLLAVMGLLLLASLLGGPPGRDVFGRPYLPDFVGHLTGGWLLQQGAHARLYDPVTQHAVQARFLGNGEADLFLSPPLTALLYLPLTVVPPAAAAALWTLLTLALLAAASRLLRPLVHGLEDARWRTALLAMAATQPVIELLGSGQDTALSLLLWLGGIRLALARRDMAAGVVFALGLFKPQLFVLPPLVLACLGRPLALGAWALTAGSLAALSLALVGTHGLASWIALLRSDAYREGIVGAQSWKMHSLPALLRELAPAALAPSASVLAGVLALVLIAYVAHSAWRMRRRAPGDEAALWMLALITTVLVSPHLFAYDLALVLPAALLAFERGGGQSVRLALAALAVLTWTSPIRHSLVETASWPAAWIGASWSALPLAVLWRALRRRANA
jgi:alpha-1,2-mannosyltransferase